MRAQSSKESIRRHWKQYYPRDPGVRREASRRLVGFLLDTPAFRSAEKIALFHPLPWEPDILALWATRPRHCYFPKVELDPLHLSFYPVESLSQLGHGHGNLMEPPADPAKRATQWGPGDLILVPGYAFDRAGGRIGTGKGFYDRFLAGVTSPKWGICFAAQITKEMLAQEPTDVRMDALCSEEGLERF